MDAHRRLIVNADDLGQSDGVNLGILEAFERGIVTSASLLVNKPASESAVRLAKIRPELDLGLHIDLGEWRFEQGCWLALYETADLDSESQTRREIESQLRQFRVLTGRQPSHLDGHQHVHLKEPVRAACLEWANRLGVPLRHVSGGVGYCGDFYGQTSAGRPIAGRITVESLMAILESLPAGVTELGCHPAAYVEFETMYRDERAMELAVLCDLRIRTQLTELGIELCTFAALSESDELGPRKSLTNGGRRSQ
jgi:predicted glycoside hydrolase/deacetylase ChbG (UPF0249 family)